MAEVLDIPNSDNRNEIYEVIVPQIKALTESEPNMIANMANMAAALKEAFNFFWVGFYLVEDENLVLGPFQGPIACTRIKKGKGVCGTAWAENKTILVPNVDEFPGHIACSSLSKSEIVIPIYQEGEIIAIMDVDSNLLDDFNEIDQLHLEELCSAL